jgi:ferrochelatase
MDATSRVGLLVMAYGTPQGPEDIPAYYTHIRHGRPPSPEQLEDLTRRYMAIGGRSPLREITQAQGEGLVQTLSRRHPNMSFSLYLGMKHSAPFLDEAVRRMAADGISQAVALVLAPLYSRGSTEEYLKEVEAARLQWGNPSRMEAIRWWYDVPSYAKLLAERVRHTLERFSPRERSEVRLVVTAHSLPVRLLEEGDPYAVQLRELAQEVARLAQVAHWRMGWQSAGRTQERWIGPDVLDILRAYAHEGVRHVVVCPAGFVSDHLEVLYDLDIEARGLAQELGIHLERTPSPNADPAFLEVLADAVDRAFQRLSL